MKYWHRISLKPEGRHTVELRHFLNMPEVYYVCRCIIMYIIVLQYFFFTGPRSLWHWSNCRPFRVSFWSIFPNLQRLCKTIDPVLISPIPPCINDERHLYTKCRVVLEGQWPRHVPIAVHDHLRPKNGQSWWSFFFYYLPARVDTSRDPL